jgi:D-alanine-D-alanine ligase-like ATP-grasp enzyme
VKLKAKIAQQTVVEKLRSMKIDVKSVSGSNLKAQLETQETMKKDGGKLINSIMEEYPKLWQASGVSYSQLLDELIELAFDRHSRRRRNTAR